jgi:hypothetical protein
MFHFIEFGNHEVLIEQNQTRTIWRIWPRGVRITRLATSQNHTMRLNEK